MVNCECHMPDAWSVDYVSSHWRKLEEQSSEHSIFQSWSWIDCWLEIAKKHIRPIIFKDNGNIIGMCFIGFGKSYDCKFFKFKTVFPFLSGSSHIDIITSEYNRIICLPEYEDVVHDALIRFLKNDKRISKISRIIIPCISEKHSLIYKNASKDIDWDFNIYKTVNAAYIDFNKIRKDNDDYNTHFSKSLKNDIRRCEKIYVEKYGNIKLERPENVTQAQNWLQELGKLNKVRFKNKGVNSAWDYPELVRMHRAFLNRQFSAQNVEIIRLCVGTTPIGYLYNFIYRGVVSFYMSGFRYEDDNRLIPGLLTHSYTIRDHFLNGKNIYDFMAGDQSYKYRMSTNTINLDYISITKKTIFFRCVNILKKMVKIFKK